MIFVVSGPGGAGKGTVVERVLALDSQLWLSRSWTTRPRRRGEPADAYVFVDRDTFLDKVAAGGFLEHAGTTGGNLYGTPVPDVPPGKDLLLEIDIPGAEQVRARHPDAVVIVVVPPDRGIQEQRLRRRGDSDEHVAARLATSDDEERRGREIADHVVVNDDLNRAVAEVAAIVDEHRRQRR